MRTFFLVIPTKVEIQDGGTRQKRVGHDLDPGFRRDDDIGAA